MEPFDQRLRFTCPRCHFPGAVALRQVVAGATIHCYHCAHPWTLVDGRRPAREAARPSLVLPWRPRAQKLPS